jgi:hypothetical protein
MRPELEEMVHEAFKLAFEEKTKDWNEVDKKRAWDEYTVNRKKKQEEYGGENDG